MLTRRDACEAYLLVNELELHGVGHGVHVDGHLAHAPRLVLHQHRALCFRRDPEHSTRAQRRLGRDGPTRQEREKKAAFFVFLLCWFVLSTAGQHRVSLGVPAGRDHRRPGKYLLNLRWYSPGSRAQPAAPGPLFCGSLKCFVMFAL